MVCKRYQQENPGGEKTKGMPGEHIGSHAPCGYRKTPDNLKEWLLDEEPAIEAHFLTCFVALAIMRILETKLAQKYSIGKLLESLSKAGCTLIQQNYYLFDYYDDVLKDIVIVLDIDFSKRIRSLGEIKKVLAGTKKQKYTMKI